MSGWFVLGIIAAVFVLIGCIPVGVDARYHENALALRLKIGFFTMQVLPAKPKKKKAAPKKEKSAPKNAAAKPAKPKKQFQMPKLTLQDILALADLACDTLGNLRRKLRVEVLVLHVTLGGSDPAKAAILYGRAWALIGMLNPKLEQLFVIKKRDIQPVLDYNEKEMKVDAHLALTITIGRAVSLAARAGVRFLKLWLNKKKAVQTT
ncbi:MAG: DUF2953 domain-containing protein [Oscillospiraceae bacterium]